MIYPINGDDTLQTHNYINTLSDRSFSDIESWISREAKRYNLSLDRPLRVTLGDKVDSVPPALPEDLHILSTIWWGLKIRHWVFFNTPDNESNLRRVRVFVAYYKGEDGKPLQHSVGLQKGGTPLFPDGYANSKRVPLYPQRYAEIMAGKIPTSNFSSYMATSLRSTQINPLTAREIAWID